MSHKTVKIFGEGSCMVSLVSLVFKKPGLLPCHRSNLDSLCSFQINAVVLLFKNRLLQPALFWTIKLSCLFSNAVSLFLVLHILNLVVASLLFRHLRTFRDDWSKPLLTLQISPSRFLAV